MEGVKSGDVMKETIEQQLSHSDFIIHSIHGNSMRPMLEEARDLVKIVPAVHPLPVGALPLIKRPSGKYVLHRIIGRKGDNYILCGDNRSFSEVVPPAWVIGVAEGFFKNGVYVPCTHPEYVSYVEKVVRRRRPRAFLLRFRLFRGVRRIKNSFGKHKKHE